MAHLNLNVDKAIGAAAYMLRLQPGRRMNYMRLLKLLYLADRKGLQDAGRSITGDRVVAMERGPVPSGVYDMIKGNHFASPKWTRFIGRDNYDVELLKDPGNKHLSRFDTSTLGSVLETHKDLDEWNLVIATHLLPEWQKNNPARSSRSSKDIPLEDILEAVGRAGIAESITREAEDSAAMDRLIRAHHGR